MKTKRIAIFPGLMLIIAMSAQAVDIPKTPFAMDPPKDWQTYNSGAMGTLIIFIDIPRDNFAANINILTEKVGDLGMEEYQKISNDNLEKLITNFMLIKREKIAIQGVPFGMFEYTGSQNKLDLHIYQVFTIYQGSVYLFTGTSLEKYAGECMPVIKQSFQTIRFAGSPGSPNPAPSTPAGQTPPRGGKSG